MLQCSPMVLPLLHSTPHQWSQTSHTDPPTLGLPVRCRATEPPGQSQTPSPSCTPTSRQRDASFYYDWLLLTLGFTFWSGWFLQLSSRGFHKNITINMTMANTERSNHDGSP